MWIFYHPAPSRPREIDYDGPVMHSRWLVAAIAFAFHQPGVRLLLGLRQQKRTRRLNALFLAATVAASLATWLVAPAEQRAWLSFAAFVAGHFLWSSVFAWLALVRFDAAFVPVQNPATR